MPYSTEEFKKRIDGLRKALQEDLEKLDELDRELEKIENEAKNNQMAS